MSCLENNILKERLAEAFEDAIKNDHQLAYKLGKVSHKLSLSYDDVYDKLEERFFEHDESCFDIRELACDVFDIEIKEKG